MTHSNDCNCQKNIIEYIKNHSLYKNIITNFENKTHYQFREHIQLKYLTTFLINMIQAGDSNINISEEISQNLDDKFNNDEDKVAYFRNIIKSFFVSEIFNTIIHKKNKKILKILRKRKEILNVIIYKLYQIKDKEPITSNWKGFKYYFENIVNMPYILFDQGISIEHFHTLHNFQGKHSEFNALVHGNPMASHGLMYESWLNIQNLYNY